MTRLETAAALMVIIPQMVAYICRLDALSWWSAKMGPVAFHFACMTLLIMCLLRTLEGALLGLGWVGMAVTGLWLLMSWPTWVKGPPAHVMR